MAFLSALVTVVFLIYLILRVSQMLGRGTSIAHPQQCAEPAALPYRSEAEIESLLATMPTAWVTYQGATPPLQLKVRGLTHELYRRFSRLYIDAYGRNIFESLPPNEAMEVAKKLLPDINAAAYVTDWDGAFYPNGNPIPYTRDNMASLMRKDELLRNFVSEEAGKIGPAW